MYYVCNMHVKPIPPSRKSLRKKKKKTPNGLSRLIIPNGNSCPKDLSSDLNLIIANLRHISTTHVTHECQGLEKKKVRCCFRWWRSVVWKAARSWANQVLFNESLVMMVVVISWDGESQKYSIKRVSVYWYIRNKTNMANSNFCLAVVAVRKWSLKRNARLPHVNQNRYIHNYMSRVTTAVICISNTYIYILMMTHTNIQIHMLWGLNS